MVLHCTALPPPWISYYSNLYLPTPLLFSIEERRAEYASTYDIVIEGDPNMDFVIQLFQALAGGESS